MDNENFRTVYLFNHEGKEVHLREHQSDTRAVTAIFGEGHEGTSNYELVEALATKLLERVKAADALQGEATETQYESRRLRTIACLQALVLDSVFDALVEQCGEGKVDPRIGFAYGAISEAFDEALR